MRKNYEEYEVVQHFVEFYSPGTFFSESDVRKIKDWDPKKAMKMADRITQRYDATPYGFRFYTSGRKKGELNAKRIDTDNKIYYLGGKIETYEEVCERNDPDEKILRENMRINKIKRIIVNTNSWRFTGEFKKNDVLLDYTPSKKRLKK